MKNPRSETEVGFHRHGYSKEKRKRPKIRPEKRIVKPFKSIPLFFGGL
jgi:hypothetical protein